MPKAGDQLGRFQIERKLGEGGMGVVYLAHDSLLEIKVALKLLSPSLALGKSEDLNRFKREVLVARQVTHPGVCRLYDIHEDDDYVFISMEYVEGPTLQAVIREKGSLAIDVAVPLMQQVGVAVAEAHELDIVHRDLKPGNVVVRDQNRISILDFGLSKALKMASITRTGVQVGTANYMSPEVIRGKGATPLSDVYSMGVILYECLTGRLPFRGESLLSIGHAIESGNPVPPTRFNPSIPPALEKIILTAMSRDPKDRFPGAQQFVRTLSWTLKGREVEQQAAAGEQSRFGEVPDEPAGEQRDSEETPQATGEEQAMRAIRESAEGPPPLPSAREKAETVEPTPEPSSKRNDSESTSQGPWDHNIDKSVLAVLEDPDSSIVIQSHLRDTTILFSDMVGITRYFDLYGDVPGYKKIQRHNDLLFPVIQRHRGTVIKTIGDAIMACFDSPEEGVGAAIGMQRALDKYNRSEAVQDEKIFVRIGLNSGPSLFKSSDVFGDAVNVAARVSAKADSREILVSEPTRKMLNPRIHTTQYHSQVTLKGKGVSCRLYQVDWGATDQAPTSVVPRSVVDASVESAARHASKRKWLFAAGGLTVFASLMLIALVFGLGRSGNDSSTDAGTMPGAIPEQEDAGSLVRATDKKTTGVTPDAGETTVAADAGSAHANPPDPAAAQAKFNHANRKFLAARSKKGIIDGDDRTLDKHVARALRREKQSKFEDALRSIKMARKRLRQIRLNDNLIQKKMLRMNVLYDKYMKRGRHIRHVEQLMGKVIQARKSGNLTKTNRLINKTIGLMRRD